MRPPIMTLSCLVLVASCSAAAGTESVGPVPDAVPSVSAHVTRPAAGPPPPLRSCPPSDDSPALASGGLPDLTLDCLDARAGVRQVRLAGLRGKPLVLSIWASWCVPCRTELPAVAQVASAAGNAVTFLGVDVEDETSDALALAADLRLGFNSVQDPDGMTKQPLGWLGPPVTLFVDAGGHVVGRTIGSVGDATALRSLIKRNLGVTVR